MNDQTQRPAPLRYGAPISLERAQHVAQAAQREARRHSWPMVIAIVDSGANLVLHMRLDQAQLGSIEVARQKAETAVRFRRPTKRFEDALAEGGLHLRLLGMTNLTPLDGGLPLVVDGHVVGAIGVSGMQSHEDAQVAEAGAAALR